jgi:hypothetical protein
MSLRAAINATCRECIHDMAATFGVRQGGEA